jgi:hypothetical protein
MTEISQLDQLAETIKNQHYTDPMQTANNANTLLALATKASSGNHILIAYIYLAIAKIE